MLFGWIADEATVIDHQRVEGTNADAVDGMFLDHLDRRRPVPESLPQQDVDALDDPVLTDERHVIERTALDDGVGGGSLQHDHRSNDRRERDGTNDRNALDVEP